MVKLKCVLCGENFNPNNDGQIYCNECKKLFTNKYLIIDEKVNNGSLDKSVADKILELYNDGYDENEISILVKVSKEYFNEIINYFYPNKELIFNKRWNNNKQKIYDKKVEEEIIKLNNKKVSNVDICRMLRF